MTRRRLRPEELELWHQIARSADPLHKRPKPKPPEEAPRPKPVGKVSQPEAKPPLSSFALGESALPASETRALPQTTGQWLRRDDVQMDAKAFQRLKRGKLRPEARIDLHGMTLDRAHGALTRFILTHQSHGHRLVLVITGKGSREDPYDPAPRRRGVLKRQVPMWLKMPPLAGAVLQISESHIRHGGEGAYYVYLRRSR